MFKKVCLNGFQTIRFRFEDVNRVRGKTQPPLAGPRRTNAAHGHICQILYQGKSISIYSGHARKETLALANKLAAIIGGELAGINILSILEPMPHAQELLKRVPFGLKTAADEPDVNAIAQRMCARTCTYTPASTRTVGPNATCTVSTSAAFVASTSCIAALSSAQSSTCIFRVNQIE